MLTPAFHFKVLEGFVDVFNKNTSILIKKLKCEVGKPGFDIEPYISDFALDVICGMCISKFTKFFSFVEQIVC